VLLVLIVPGLAVIGVVVVAAAALAGVAALAGAVLALPYLLVGTLRRRIATRQPKEATGLIGRAVAQSAPAHVGGALHQM
jgi:hypothetical protein